MEVIKLLGTNGGSFYGVGGAHPFENPTGFTNMWQLLLVIVLPFAIVFMFGRMVGRPRQAYAIVAMMAIIFLGHTVVSMRPEAHGNPHPPAAVSQAVTANSPGGTMEGKETRFGPESSALMTKGSAFAGIAANTTWYNYMLGLIMLVGRFAPIVLALAIAGSLAHPGSDR